jgi:hypothetical protein
MGGSVRTDRFRLFSGRGAGFGVLAVMVATSLLILAAAGLAALLLLVL